MFSLEVFASSALAYMAAGFAYVFAFAPLAEALYRWQDANIGENVGFRANVNWQAINLVREQYEFSVTISATEFLLGFAMVAVFTLLVGIMATSFIARHEPMKTMIGY